MVQGSERLCTTSFEPKARKKQMLAAGERTRSWEKDKPDAKPSPIGLQVMMIDRETKESKRDTSGACSSALQL